MFLINTVVYDKTYLQETQIFKLLESYCKTLDPITKTNLLYTRASFTIYTRIFMLQFNVFVYCQK